VGAGALALLTIAAVVVPWALPYSPSEIDLRHAATAPGLAHPLGTDALGRDVLVRVLYGSGVSLLVGVSSMLVAAGIGVPYGAVAGYYGGRADALMMRAVDFLLLVLASFRKASLLDVILYIGLFGWMGMARLVRGQVLVLRERDFVVAARSLGASASRIIVRHLLPSAVPPVIVAASLGVAGAMLVEAALDFLGFGVPPDTPTLGNLVSEGEQYMTSLPLLAIAPGMTITVAVVCVNLIGDALRDALDVHSAARHG
jgi:ABC-type dipeptide/oligopeptide/nickel transport system permease subunit